MHARIQILGRVGREPQQRFGNDGNGFTTFSVVVNRKYKNRSGELQEQAEWFDVIVGGKTGENVVKYVNKGDMIYLEGGVTARVWEGSDGEPKASINVRAFTVEFIGGGGGGNAGGEKKSKGTKSGVKKKKQAAQRDLLSDDDDGDDSEIPF